MIRVVVFLLFVMAAALGLSWLADRPGNLVINWEGHEIQTTVFHAIVMLALFLVVAIVAWSLIRGIWHLPADLGSFFSKRREKRGLEALSSGMIAIGSGDKSLATRYAVQARKSLPNEPLTHILRAQAAQLAGDRATSRRIYEAMLSAPETEPLGLRGLFLEAERENETEAARQFAERALELNPKLSWPVHSLFDLQCQEQDWAGALATLATAKKHGHIEKAQADRKRAVLLTAQAQAAEDSDPETALKLADEAHTLAADLVPAAAIAGRLYAARGNVQKAAKVIQKAWRKGPHPDLATAYAYARVGDSPRDRLARVKELASLSPHSLESPVAVANAAIEAREFEVARSALEPLLDDRLTQRVCTLMAKIEIEDGGNAGLVREWLARAVNAPRDPAWTADGVISDTWAPVSPVTGALDAFQWRVPVEAVQGSDKTILHEKIEELVKLGVRPEVIAGGAAASAAAPGAIDAGADAEGREAGDDIVIAAAGDGPIASQDADKASDAIDAEIVDVTPKPKPEPKAEAAAAAAHADAATSADRAPNGRGKAAAVGSDLDQAGEDGANVTPKPDRDGVDTGAATAGDEPRVTQADADVGRGDGQSKNASGASTVAAAASGDDAKHDPTDGDSGNPSGDPSRSPDSATRDDSKAGHTPPERDDAAKPAAAAAAAAAVAAGGGDSGEGDDRATARDAIEASAGDAPKSAAASDTQTSDGPADAASVRADGGSGASRRPVNAAPDVFISPRAPDDPGPDGADVETAAVAGHAPARYGSR